MASAFDKASLVMLPNAYKDQKLYSVKPTDRSGDFAFSRDGAGASPATRVGPTGLIEKGRENLLTYSNDFSIAPWALSSATITGGQSGYDGTNDAWLLEKSAANGRVFQNIALSGVQTFSVYAKAAVNDWAFLLVNGGGNPAAWFDLSTGSLGSAVGGVISHNISDVGNGWYKISITYNETISRVRIYVGDTNNDNSGTSGSIYIQSAQLEVGLAATDYIETTTAPVSAGLLGDMPRLDYSGGAECPSLLLEPSRTNLVTQSEYIDGISGLSEIGASFDTNVTTSPEGLSNASLLKEDSSNGSHFAYKDFNLTSGSTYTISIFAKANGANRNLRFGDGNVGWTTNLDSDFDLTAGTATNVGVIKPMGNGWYRCSVTGTTNATSSRLLIYSMLNNSTSYQGDGTSGLYLYGFQVEEGSYPTSYIPTYGSVSARGDESSAFELSVLDFFSLDNTQSGTFFIETKYIKPSANNYADMFSQGGSGTNTWVTTAFQIRDTGGSRNFTVQHIDSVVDDYIKIIIRKDLTTYNVFVNGVKSSTTATITNPLRWFDHISLYRNSQKVKQIIEFPTALSDVECINLTTL